MGEKFEQRKQVFVDAINFKEGKVPVTLQMMNYAFAYAGVRYQDIVNDEDAVVKAFTKHLYDLNPYVDAVQSGIAAPIDVYQAMGNTSYVWGSDGCTTAQNNEQMRLKFVQREEYDQFMQNMSEFVGETIPKRSGAIYQKPFDEAYEQFKAASLVALRNERITKRISDAIEECEYIRPFAGEKHPRYMSPFNSLFDFYRGIEGALTDLRRCPEKVDEACEMILQRTVSAPAFKNLQDHYEPYPLARATCHSECFLSPKQFEKYFMQPFKKYYMQFVERGGKYYMRGEGCFAWNIDVMQDLPKGTMSIMLDKDDPFEMYEKYMKDKMPIGAGITSILLKQGTPDQCRDYVKKCYDTFAPGGGFFFAQNEGLLCASDATIENLMATYETARMLSDQR